MGDDEGATRKRKLAEEKAIGLLFHPLDPSPLIYQFRIRIINRPGAGSDVEADDKQILSPIVNLYDLDGYQQNGVAGCAVVGSKLFLVPDESEEMESSNAQRLYPLQFDLVTNQTIPLPNCPHAPKVYPFAIPIEDKVYVLSGHTMSVFHSTPEPSFETYDLSTGSWDPLPRPPFHNQEHNWDVNAYALLEKEDDDEDGKEVFILVTGTQRIRGRDPTVAFFSYNVRTRAWKNVSLAEGMKKKYPMCDGEAVTVAGYIYAYAYWPDKRLVAFSYHYHSEEEKQKQKQKGLFDLSLGPPFSVKGFRMGPWPGTREDQSGTIGKIGDRMLCVVQTAQPWLMPWRCVDVSIIKICEDDPWRFLALKSFTCSLPEQVACFLPLVASCFVLPQAVSSSKEQVEGGRDEKRLVRYISDNSLTSGVEMAGCGMERDVAEMMACGD